MEYTINRVLAMIKTTKERINSEIGKSRQGQFIVVAKGQEDNVKGVSIKEIERDIQARYDKANALINNYIRLKAAVLKSNVGVNQDAELRTISVAGRNITMAEMIDLRDIVYGKSMNLSTSPKEFYLALLRRLKDDYASAQMSFDLMKSRADEEVADYIKALTNNKKDDKESDTATKAAIEATAEMLHKQKDPRFIDPLKIADKIAALESEIQKFQEESDAAMSTENALRTVNIDLAEVA